MKTFAQIRTRSAGVTSMVNAFRGLEDTTGRVVSDVPRAENLLRAMMPAVLDLCSTLGQQRIGEAFGADAEAWIAAGLGETPCFDRTQAAFAVPRNGDATFFVAPLLAHDAPAPTGHFLECFLAVRDEPQGLKEVAVAFPHPGVASPSGRLVLGSDGIQKGSCLAFLTENVATREPAESKSSAFSFANKFQAIYEGETMARVRRAFGSRDVLFGTSEWVSSGMQEAACYEARAIWGYLHDLFRQSGPRPQDRGPRATRDFFTTLLAEIKCDCQTAILAATEDLPNKRELVEIILFERLFRYPSGEGALRSSDAATGVLLFEWLAREGAISRLEGSRLHIDLRITVVAMRSLVARIEQLERIANDKAYQDASEVFVRTILPGGNIGDKFAYPEAYARMARARPSGRRIDLGQVTLR